MATKENKVVKYCLQYLSLKGYYAWRQNNYGVQRFDKTYNRSYYMFHGERGVSDIIAIKSGRVFFIECKAPGKCDTQSDSQLIFQQNIQRHGGIYMIVDSVKMLEKKMRGVL